MKNKLLIFVFLLFLPGVILALSPNDFAYVADIQTAPGSPYYELEIPATVYETAAREDLGDIRVFNGSGQIVPHGFRTHVAEQTSEIKQQSVPFFPLYQQSGESDADLHLNIQRNANGEIIDIRNNRTAPDEAERLAGYLLDLRQWKQAIDQLKVSWDASPQQSFIHKLRISSSQDLSRWNTVANGMTLVSLSYQGQQLVEDTIKLSASPVSYLRIMFDDDKPGLELNDIQVQSIKSSQHEQLNWHQARVTETQIQGEYAFENPFKARARQLRLELPEQNTVVKVHTFSRANDGQKWRGRGSGLFYRLSVDGVSIQQTEMKISATRDSDWQLHIDQQGGGLGSGLTKLEIGWLPHNLVFVARGQPPFQFAWGSARVEPAIQDANKILVGSGKDAEKNGERDMKLIANAGWLADSIRSVNPAALEAEFSYWRQWILWAVLIISAVILVWMALRLMSKMKDVE